MAVPEMIENRTFDEIAVGDTASITRTLREEDIQLFALVSGDVNPAHLDADYAATDLFHRVIAHGMWGGGLISAVLGTELPGPGAIYLSQSLRFTRPVGLGDAITTSVTVTEKRSEHHVLLLDCRCVNQNGDEVITGQAEVRAPTEKIRLPRIALPDVRISDHDGYRKLIERTRADAAPPTAVAHPCSASSSPVSRVMLSILWPRACCSQSLCAPKRSSSRLSCSSSMFPPGKSSRLTRHCPWPARFNR